MRHTLRTNINSEVIKEYKKLPTGELEITYLDGNIKRIPWCAETETELDQIMDTQITNYLEDKRFKRYSLQKQIEKKVHLMWVSAIMPAVSVYPIFMVEKIDYFHTVMLVSTCASAIYGAKKANEHRNLVKQLDTFEEEYSKLALYQEEPFKRMLHDKLKITANTIDGYSFKEISNLYLRFERLQKLRSLLGNAEASPEKVLGNIPKL